MDKNIRKQIDSRERIITTLLQHLEQTVNKSQQRLFETVQEHFLNTLERNEEGKIAPTLKNRRLLERFDKVFRDYSQTSGANIAVEIAKGANSIMETNKEYYSLFADGKTQLNKISEGVTQTMRGWLGIDRNGSVAKNGYLDTILSNNTVKNLIKDQTLRAIVGQQGWMQTRDELKDFIVGNRTKTGVLERYYRNYVYDTYSHLDRAVSEQYGNDLGLNFAIYEGGLIEASREFCREHNGNVYHRTEIAKFDPKKAIPPNYNPFLDLGGYGCRHHLNWIPDSVAIRMRPEAKKFIDPDAKVEEKKPTEKKEESKYIFNEEAMDRMETRGYNVEDLRGSTILEKRFAGLNLEAIDDVVMKAVKDIGTNIRRKTISQISRNTVQMKIYSNKLTLIRNFEFSEGKRKVDHYYFSLDDSAQGKGYSKQIFRELFRQYENADVDIINVEANIDVGGYAWARYGFRAYKKHIGSVINKARDIVRFKLRTEEEMKDFYDFMSQYGDDDIVPMEQLAAKPYGMAVLKGSNWKGFLDMKDPVQVQIYKDYLNLK